MKTIDIMIVGAGAAGLMAAIHASREGASVVVLEHMDMPGKKLRMTGNGKCNFTNSTLLHTVDLQGDSFFHGACPAFVLPVFTKFSAKQTVQFFEELSILPSERYGGLYPSSGQAVTILNVLLMECDRLGVEIRYNIGIRDIYKSKNEFVFDTKSGEFRAKKCILATGGKSYKKTGSDGSGFLYVERLGHHIQHLVPALVPLQSDLAFFKKVAGIRAEISAKIAVNQRMIDHSRGELQLTDYGLSGICIFQLSYVASRALLSGEQVTVHIDFCPGASEEEMVHRLCTIAKSEYSMKKTIQDIVTAFFPDKLGTALLEQSVCVKATMPAAMLTESTAEGLVREWKNFVVPITGTRGFDQAQITAGGVDTNEIANETLESKLIPGLYFAGEMIDIDAICGGYNLQWAWSSGAVAGKSAAGSIKA